MESIASDNPSTVVCKLAIVVKSSSVSISFFFFFLEIV